MDHREVAPIEVEISSLRFFVLIPGAHDAIDLKRFLVGYLVEHKIPLKSTPGPLIARRLQTRQLLELNGLFNIQSKLVIILDAQVGLVSLPLLYLVQLLLLLYEHYVDYFLVAVLV